MIQIFIKKVTVNENIYSILTCINKDSSFSSETNKLQILTNYDIQVCIINICHEKKIFLIFLVNSF